MAKGKKKPFGRKVSHIGRKFSRKKSLTAPGLTKNTRMKRGRWKNHKKKLTGKGPGGMPVIEGTVGGTQGDPLDFQISARVKISKGRTISARVLTEAIRYRCENGRNPKGIQLRIIRWRNPARKETSADWRYPEDVQVIENTRKMLGLRAGRISPQQAAWVTLRQALEAVQVADLSLGGRR